MITRDKLLNFVMYSFLFIFIFTSSDWNHINPEGEIFRFDRYRLFLKIDIYYFYSFIFFGILFMRKFIFKTDHHLWGEKNYLKNIFWLYFIPVNLLIYFAIQIKDIQLTVGELGVTHVMRSFVFLTALYYIQDIFLKKRNSQQLDGFLTAVQVIICIRCLFSIGKYYMGYGHVIRGYNLGLDTVADVLRLGQENDFADYFILLFIISFTRFLLPANKGAMMQGFNVLAIIAASYISILSGRRYLWVEYLLSAGTILFFYYRFKKTDIYHKRAVLACSIIFIILSAILISGPENLKDNYYLGRLSTIVSIVDPAYESKYGSQEGHVDEIKDGWLNVSKHWLLGVSPFGRGLLERTKATWQHDVFVHNAYLNVWLVFGLMGFILFLALYYKSLQLGYVLLFKMNSQMGLILLTYMIAQLAKNIVWSTAIVRINETLIYILLISIALRTRVLLQFSEAQNESSGH